MDSKLQNEYYPDSVSPPGETLSEVLEAIDMSPEELARRVDCSADLVNEIIQENAAITPETALQLEQALHIPVSFWLNRERRYREYLARPVKEQQ